MTDLDESLARRTTRATLATRVLIVAAVVVGVGIASVLTYTTLAIRAQQRDSASILVSIHNLSEQITSCTTPEGKCARRGQRQQGQVLGHIDVTDKANAAAAATCAKEIPHPTVPLVLRCMDQKLAGGGRAP